MPRFAIVALALVSAGAAFAQRSVITPGGGGAARGGFGSVVFPGGSGRVPGGMPAGPGVPFRSPFSITDPGFAQRLGNTVSGFPQRGSGGGHSGGNRSVVVVPYGYPVGVPYGWGAEQQAPPQVTIINTPPQGPQVIINQNYIPETANPVIREYGSYGDPNGAQDVSVYQAPARPVAEETAAANDNRSYLLAFKDHSIYSALAYWVQGDTLHYVTPAGTHNQASLDLIDRDFTEQLNRERRVQMRLPGR